MRKLLTFLSIIFICNTASAQIPNAGFETWDTTTLGPIFYVPVGWDNLDSVTHLIGLYSCTKGTPAFAGSSYLKLKSFSPPSSSAVVPGLAVSGRINYVTPYGAKYGYPFTSRPANLSGEWQYMASGSDQGSITVFLSKWNTTTVRRDTVGYAHYNLPGMAMTWAAFNVPIKYYTGGSPDSAIIALTSSNPGTAAAAGSYLYIDTLQFTGSVPTGTITLNTEPVLNAANTSQMFVYPNPAVGAANIAIRTEVAGDVQVSISDVSGRMVQTMTVKTIVGNNSIPMDISKLSKGVYMVKTVSDDFTAVEKLNVE